MEKTGDVAYLFRGSIASRLLMLVQRCVRVS